MSPITPPLSFNPAGIELDRRQGLTRQLYEALRQRVLDGRLVSGTRLPATRDLAAALSISRNSVVRAYDQLYAEGFGPARRTAARSRAVARALLSWPRSTGAAVPAVNRLRRAN